MDSCLGRRRFRSQFRRLIKIYFYVVCHGLWVGLAVCVGSVGYVVGIHGWVRVQGLGGPCRGVDPGRYDLWLRRWPMDVESAVFALGLRLIVVYAACRSHCLEC